MLSEQLPTNFKHFMCPFLWLLSHRPFNPCKDFIYLFFTMSKNNLLGYQVQVLLNSNSNIEFYRTKVICQRLHEQIRYQQQIKSSVAGWLHAVTSYFTMQEPERKLSEPSVWEHPPDWQGVPSTLCKCTLFRSHSPACCLPMPTAQLGKFKTTEITFPCFTCNDGVSDVPSDLWCFMTCCEWILEGSLLSLLHCKCHLCSN